MTTTIENYYRESVEFYRNFYEDVTRKGGLLDKFHAMGVTHGLALAQIDCLKGGSAIDAYDRIAGRAVKEKKS